MSVLGLIFIFMIRFSQKMGFAAFLFSFFFSFLSNFYIIILLSFYTLYFKLHIITKFLSHMLYSKLYSSYNKQFSICIYITQFYDILYFLEYLRMASYLHSLTEVIVLYINLCFFFSFVSKI
jgi:hypothetical protein